MNSHIFGAREIWRSNFRAHQNCPKSVSQSHPSLDQSSQCKGGFQSYLSKLYIDNGITYVQLNLFGERSIGGGQTFDQEPQKWSECRPHSNNRIEMHLPLPIHPTGANQALREHCG